MKEQTEILRTDHNIQYSPKSIQKTVNMNNVFSKCPGLHKSTRRDEKEISFQRPVHSQMKTEKAACALRRKTSSSHGSLENKDLAWRGVRSTFFSHAEQADSSCLSDSWRHSQRAPALPAKETDVQNLRRGKRRSLRHLSTIRPERLPPTSRWKEPSDLPEHP